MPPPADPSAITDFAAASIGSAWARSTEGSDMKYLRLSSKRSRSTSNCFWPSATACGSSEVAER